LNILITNDDGIFSPGIYALWEVAQEFGSVCVVAPNSQKSAAGHSITISRPLFADKIKRRNGFKGTSVTGTPADCVKFGIKKIIGNNPDLILSGINLGSNLGSNIIYSGTVAAAVEGAMQNIPSIAFSLDSSDPVSFDNSKIIVRQIIKLAIENNIAKNFIWNVNIPNCGIDQFKGIKVASQGNQYFNDDFDTKLDPKGNEYYWMVGNMVDCDNTFDSDSYVVKNDYASISPIGFNLSSSKEIEEIRKILD
tara:strand:+ start:1691 stop:2443 length:753 start_codon:yes stop_codon:yes gene_type:complete